MEVVGEVESVLEGEGESGRRVVGPACCLDRCSQIGRSRDGCWVRWHQSWLVSGRLVGRSCGRSYGLIPGPLMRPGVGNECVVKFRPGYSVSDRCRHPALEHLNKPDDEKE